MPTGSPKYETVEDLEAAITKYFESLKYVGDNNEIFYHAATITGLAFDLGFCSRQSLYDYEKNPLFSYTIGRARLRVERSYEKHLLSRSSAGAVFALKNFGWSENIKIESTNTNLNAELTDEEKEAAIDRVTKGLDEFKDYE